MGDYRKCQKSRIELLVDIAKLKKLLCIEGSRGSVWQDNCPICGQEVSNLICWNPLGVECEGCMLTILSLRGQVRLNQLRMERKKIADGEEDKPNLGLNHENDPQC